MTTYKFTTISLPALLHTLIKKLFAILNQHKHLKNLILMNHFSISLFPPTNRPTNLFKLSGSNLQCPPLPLMKHLCSKLQEMLMMFT